MSKSLVDGLMRKILVAGEEIDVDQGQMTAVLLNEHKDGDGKWPDDIRWPSHKRMWDFLESEFGNIVSYN